MEVYLILKFAIKYTNIGLIKWVIIYYYLLFTSSVKSKYIQLALYLIKLLITKAVDLAL